MDYITENLINAGLFINIKDDSVLDGLWSFSEGWWPHIMELLKIWHGEIARGIAAGKNGNDFFQALVEREKRR